jgi:type IV secretion system protein VirD4
MRHRIKVVAVLLLLVTALGAGFFLSGYLTLLLLGLHDAPLRWNTYWEYLSAQNLPQVAPYASRIKLSGAIGFGLPVLLWLPVLIPLLKRKAPSIHGDARFARRADLASAGLFEDDPYALILGKFGNKLIRLSGQQHVLLCAPTRSGKTVGVAIPNLLYYQGSVVALDIKGELHDKTSEWRQQQGQHIFVFAPLAEDARTHRFNPLQCISPNPGLRVNQLQSVAAILFPDEPHKDPFWTHSARSAFFGFAMFMFDAWDDMVNKGMRLDPDVSPQFPSFERIYRLSSSDGRDMKVYLQELIKAPFLSSEARTALANLVSQAEQTLSSIMASMHEPLHAFLNPVLAAATNASDFDVTWLRKKKMSIYVVISPDKLGEARKILNIFFSMVIGQNVKELPGENKAIRHPCLLLMDEFTSIGRIDILASSISHTAGYWMRSLPIIQSQSQLDATYGAEVATTFKTNHAGSIVFAPREQRDAEDYARMLGDTTVQRKNRTLSRGGGARSSVSYAEVQERRPLMLPQELKALGNDLQLVFYEGVPHAIKCRKIVYYKDAFFKRRLLGKLEIPSLKLEGKRAGTVKVTLSDDEAALRALAEG